MLRLLSCYIVVFVCMVNQLTIGGDIIPIPVDISNASATNQAPLNCTVSIGNSTLTWTFKPSYTETKKLIDTTNTTYMISSPAKTGTYECANGDTVIRKFIAQNFSNPYIPHTGRSIVLTEGWMNQTVECFAFSYPQSTLTWTVLYSDSSSPISLTGKDSKTFSIREVKSGYSVLTISTVTFAERGVYSCIAESRNFTSSASVLIRIHGRLTSLWPFLGIICEILVVACIIIAVRRKSTTTDSEDPRTSFLISNSSESSQSGANPNVRFRGGGK